MEGKSARVAEPLVSILIPVYRRVEFAIEAIDSSLRQHYQNTEIIVGDNCSKDGTYEKLKKRYDRCEKITIFQNEENLGAVGNWMRCLQIARGKYIKFLWSDDLMSPFFLTKSIKLLEKNPDASFAFSEVCAFTNKEELADTLRFKKNILYKLKKKTGVYLGRDFLYAAYNFPDSIPLSPGCAVFRKEKVMIIDSIPNKVGYSHRTNGAGPDLLMFLEALSKEEKFIFIEEAMNFFRIHNQSISVFDTTIMDGYLSAMLYYIEQHSFEEYRKSLYCHMISCVNQKRIFNKENNKKAISRYVNEHEAAEANILRGDILFYKIRKFINCI